MRRSIASCVFCLALCSVVFAQDSILKPIHVPAGTTLTFYVQTRLNSEDATAVDLLPKGTQLIVKVLEPIDSTTSRDGSEFHGVVTSPVVSGGETVIRADAEAKGLFVLLRSKNHPDGFRYELLISEISDGGKPIRLTASLNTSFFDAPSQTSAKQTLR